MWGLVQVRFAYLHADAPDDLDQKFLDQLFPGGIEIDYYYLFIYF